MVITATSNRSVRKRTNGAINTLWNHSPWGLHHIHGAAHFMPRGRSGATDQSPSPRRPCILGCAKATDAFAVPSGMPRWSIALRGLHRSYFNLFTPMHPQLHNVPNAQEASALIVSSTRGWRLLLSRCSLTISSQQFVTSCSGN